MSKGLTVMPGILEKGLRRQAYRGKSQFNYPAAMGEKPGSPSPCTDPAAPNSSYGTTELGAD